MLRHHCSGRLLALRPEVVIRRRRLDGPPWHCRQAAKFGAVLELRCCGRVMAVKPHHFAPSAVMLQVRHLVWEIHVGKQSPSEFQMH